MENLQGKPFSELDPKLQPLVDAAHDARTRAYCPYSNFHVGAAVLTEDGTIIGGCNVENASYGLAVCAERTALLTAVAAGYQKFKAMALVCDVKDTFKGPCGACRQFMVEFGLNWDLYLTKPDKSWAKVRVGDMMPIAFCPESLQLERVSISQTNQ